MNLQELYEFADREIRLGSYDRGIMARAKESAGGVEAVMHQNYWRLRAEAIQGEARNHPGVPEDLYLRELISRLDRAEGGRRLRANLIGWMWVLVCFGSFCGAAISFWAARSAFIHGRGSFYAYGGTGVFLVALAVVAYVVSKRDAGQDPFSDW